MLLPRLNGARPENAARRVRLPLHRDGRRLAAVVLLLAAGLASGQAAERGLPKPLAGHPGNVFLAGEEVVVAVPAKSPDRWQLRDYDDRLVAEPTAADGRLTLGPLPVGWYRLRRAEAAATEWISLAVLAPLQAPTPATSPIASDVAMAWFYRPEEMPAVASLCALAGLNWVRDRLNWAEVEPQRGRLLPPPTRYDASAAAQSAAGLQVLQVNHISPAWANPNDPPVPHGPPRRVSLLPRDGRPLARPGPGLRTVERSGHRRVRRPHRQRDRVPAEGGLPGTESRQPPGHRRPERVRRASPGPAGRLPCQPGLALLRHLQPASLRGLRQLPRLVRRLPPRVGRPAAVGHRMLRCR